MRHRIHIQALCLFSSSLFTWPAVMAEEQPAVEQRTTVVEEYRPRKPDRSAAARDKIHKALEEPTSLKFVETPLSDVIDHLKKLHGIDIQFDHKALEEAGSGTDTPVTKNLRDISLDAALHLILGPMDLVYLTEDEVLLITTQEQAGHSVSLRVYDCRWAADRIPQLVEVLAFAKPIGLPIDEDPLSLRDEFKIVPWGTTIVARATPLQHEAIERVLIKMRRPDAKPPVQAKAAAGSK